MAVLILTDNNYIYKKVREITSSSLYKKYDIQFAYSHFNNEFKELYKNSQDIIQLNISEKIDWIIESFDVIISLHCKQIFPARLVSLRRCINIHPGYNPFNRGYFPHIFSIINKKTTGVTIHEMDEYIDHGPIIIQKNVCIEAWNDAKSLYEKIIKLEIQMIQELLPDIIENNYSTFLPYSEGNINYLSDFKKLCQIDLQERLTMGEAIDRLRALTFSGNNNAYFFDNNGEKVWVEIKLKKDENNNIIYLEE